jgi:hypothetical protein
MSRQVTTIPGPVTDDVVGIATVRRATTTSVRSHWPCVGRAPANRRVVGLREAASDSVRSDSPARSRVARPSTPASEARARPSAQSSQTHRNHTFRPVSTRYSPGQSPPAECRTARVVRGGEAGKASGDVLDAVGSDDQCRRCPRSGPRARSLVSHDDAQVGALSGAAAGSTAPVSESVRQCPDDRLIESHDELVDLERFAPPWSANTVMSGDSPRRRRSNPRDSNSTSSCGSAAKPTSWTRPSRWCQLSDEPDRAPALVRGYVMLIRGRTRGGWPFSAQGRGRDRGNGPSDVDVARSRITEISGGQVPALPESRWPVSRSQPLRRACDGF